MTTAIDTTIFSEIITTSTIEDSFSLFVDHLQEWWPREYTWSQHSLKRITIAPYINGHCFETGPYEFRCDWGRVIEFERPYLISFSWQISPARVPVPDPEKASKVSVSFKTLEDKTVRVRLIHSNFDKHGPDWEQYARTMNSEQGWSFILESYRQFLESYRSRPRKIIQ
jgi:uncharacterized protein YndB with AHSA1/START domain